MVLKNKVKFYRIKCGYSQSYLAELCGVSRNTISSIETCAFSPSAKLAYLLCIHLSVDFFELFCLI